MIERLICNKIIKLTLLYMD